MLKKTNHLAAAVRSTGAIRDVRKVIHSQLAEVYIALSQDLTEESRSRSLDLLNDAMKRVRMLDEAVEYVELAHKGVNANLREVSALLADMRSDRFMVDGESTGRMTGGDRFSPFKGETDSPDIG